MKNKILNSDPLTEAFLETNKGKAILNEFQNTYKFLQFSKKESPYFLRSPLGKAFLELEKKGFLISMECGENGDDGRGKMESLGVDKPYIFFNRLEFKQLLEKGETYLHFGGNLSSPNKNLCPVCGKKLIKPQISEEGEVLNCDLKFEIRENIRKDFIRANDPESGVDEKFILDRLQKPICVEHPDSEEQPGHLIVRTLSSYGIESGKECGHVNFELEPYYINYFSCFDLIYKRCRNLFTSEIEDLILMFLGSYINEDELISLVSTNRKLAESKIYFLFDNLFNKDFNDFYLFFKDLLIEQNWSTFDNSYFNYSGISTENKSEFIDDLNIWEQAYLSIIDFFDEESIKERISILLGIQKKEVKFKMRDNVLNSDDAFSKAKYYSEEGEKATAIRHINSSINLDPNNISKLLFRCELNAFNDPKNTLEDLHKVEKLGYKSSKLFKLKAECYRQKGDYKSSLRAYCDGINKFPEDLNLYLDRCMLRCYYLESEFEEVINDCRFVDQYTKKNNIELPRKSAIDSFLLIAKTNLKDVDYVLNYWDEYPQKGLKILYGRRTLHAISAKAEFKKKYWRFKWISN